MNRLALLLIVSGLCISGLFAQGRNIIVFSEAGEPFTLVIDGQQRNTRPAVRVAVTDVRSETPVIVVRFADPALPGLKQDSWLAPGKEYTLVIATDKPGGRVLRMQGEAPLTAAQGTDRSPAGHVQPTNQGRVQVAGERPVKSRAASHAPSTLVPAAPMQQGLAPATDTRTNRAPQQGGCGQPMDAAGFEQALANIQAKATDEPKLSLAKQIAGRNCLSTAQVKAMLGVFGFEDSKLDFAKFAYDHLADRTAYVRSVRDAFNFSASAAELETYVRSR